MFPKMTGRMRKFCPYFVVLLVAFFYVVVNLLTDSFVAVESRHGIPTPAIPRQEQKPVTTVLQTTTTARQHIWYRPENNPLFFTPRKSVVNPLNYNVVISGDPDCVNDPPFLTVLVLSMHSSGEYRDAIRNTWGSLARNNSWPGFNITEKIKLVFLFGTAQSSTQNEELKAEAKQTRDIVMFDFLESYFNLTYKVLMGFKWVQKFCPETKFVLKCDEDTFVNIPKVVERLRSKEWNTKIAGPYFTNEITRRGGKYEVAVSAYPFRIYPAHVKGNIYFMPTDLARKLLNASYYMPYVNMEDAYITGILAKSVGGINYKGLNRNEYSPSRALKGCEFLSKVASQQIQPTDARDIWKKLNSKTDCK
ncbi:beta-1,3-galactosyltransferase 5 isoform X2 [Patella vulgata]|nr:beta-1,3-galactosyltransferase 5 isoform X2 [Patella vulgata]XP_050410726.1 beta-1,3-galactosyltransferase 5 isoform X2 [Patella vulgata]XP_050410727.1 beta-1,3-galactosyltransferase 5 isoform X2 [Patella vulgata]